MKYPTFLLSFFFFIIIFWFLFFSSFGEVPFWCTGQDVKIQQLTKRSFSPFSYSVRLRCHGFQTPVLDVRVHFTQPIQKRSFSDCSVDGGGGGTGTTSHTLHASPSVHLVSNHLHRGVIASSQLWRWKDSTSSCHKRPVQRQTLCYVSRSPSLICLLTYKRYDNNNNNNNTRLC